MVRTPSEHLGLLSQIMVVTFSIFDGGGGMNQLINGGSATLYRWPVIGSFTSSELWSSSRTGKLPEGMAIYQL